jgi:hypothetical protein
MYTNMPRVKTLVEMLEGWLPLDISLLATFSAPGSLFTAFS